MSTAEAAARILLELEGGDLYREQYDALLHALRVKVDAMRMQKSRTPVYGTEGDGSEGED